MDTALTPLLHELLYLLVIAGTVVGLALAFVKRFWWVILVVGFLWLLVQAAPDTQTETGSSAGSAGAYAPATADVDAATVAASAAIASGSTADVRVVVRGVRSRAPGEPGACTRVELSPSSFRVDADGLSVFEVGFGSLPHECLLPLAVAVPRGTPMPAPVGTQGLVVGLPGCAAIRGGSAGHWGIRCAAAGFDDGAVTQATMSTYGRGYLALAGSLVPNG
jgi:hypothetical protein